MKRYIYLIVASIVVLASCKDEIPMPQFEQGKQRVVVDAMISTEKTRHYVKLSSTVEYASQQDPLPISNAVVTISDDSVTYKLRETTPGLYLTDSLSAKVWKTYKLRVEVGGQTYEASSTLYPRLLLDTLLFGVQKQRFGNNNNTGSDAERTIYAYQRSTANKDVFFFIKRIVNGVMQNDSLQSWSYTSEEFSSGLIDRFGRVSRSKLKYGDTVTIVAYSSPKEYLEYYAAIVNNMQPPTPFFSGPPANPQTNISNNGLGYFLACDVTRITSVYNRQTDIDSMPSSQRKRYGLE